jgi:hypothetical protein
MKGAQFEDEQKPVVDDQQVEEVHDLKDQVGAQGRRGRSGLADAGG